jgi:hypothetical protein
LVVDQKQFVGYNYREMPILEAPNKPKKYQVVEYPVQKVDNLEQKRQESQAVFETLSLEDREKYYEAYAEFVQKAKALGFDQVENYDIFFESRVSSNGSFSVNQEGVNFITIGKEFVLDSEKLLIIKTLFHELVGHCLSSKNLSKVGTNADLDNSGLSFDQFRNSRYIEINKARIIEIVNKIGLNSKSLSKDDFKIINKFAEIAGAKDKFLAIYTLAESFEDYSLLIDELKESFNGNKNIGRSLNEGVTDYLAINMTVDNDEQFWELVEKSGYEEYILPIVDMGSHLIKLDPANLQAWDDCLYDARLTGQPYKIIKFLKDKTGVSITPKELFALDFSKILGMEEDNTIDKINGI